MIHVFHFPSLTFLTFFVYCTYWHVRLLLLLRETSFLHSSFNSFKLFFIWFYYWLDFPLLSLPSSSFLLPSSFPFIISHFSTVTSCFVALMCSISPLCFILTLSLYALFLFSLTYFLFGEQLYYFEFPFTKKLSKSSSTFIQFVTKFVYWSWY